MKKTLLFTLAAMLGTGAYAQEYLKLAPEGGFDINSGKDYVILYAPDQVITKMGDKVLTNDNLDPASKKNTLEYWVTDWDKSLLTMYNVPIEPPVKNSFGIEGEYINGTPLFDWGTGVFVPKSQKYDLSKVTNQHHLHIGLRDFGDNGTKKTTYKFQVGSQSTIKKNGLSLEAGLPIGNADGDYVGIGNIPGTSGADAPWVYLDIPMSVLTDENGDFGFNFDFPNEISDGVFLFQFGNPNCSTYTAGSIPPSETIKEITVTKLGTALSLDHVFFYVPEKSGVQSIMDAAPETIEAIYTIDGRQVNSMNKGIYLVKTNKGTKKVIL